MATYLLTYSILSLLLGTSAAHKGCGTKITAEEAAYAMELERNFLQHKRFDPDKPYISLVKHFSARNDEGLIALEEDMTIAETVALNKYFSTGNIQFVMDTYEIIDGEEYFNYRGNIALIDPYIRSNSFNVFWSNIVQIGTELYCGYAYFPWGYHKQLINMNSECIGTVLSHEMGHCLGLYHTHEQVGEVERADGSNCDFGGDLVCDTPGDPGLGYHNVDAMCTYFGTSTDPLGQLYQPDPTNIMSYSHYYCFNHFTPGQWQRTLMFSELVRSAFVESNINVIKNDYGIAIQATSSHPVMSWVVLFNSVIVDTNMNCGSKVHSFTVLGAPYGTHNVSVEICYSYIIPETQTNYCTSKSLLFDYIDPSAEYNTTVSTGILNDTSSITTETEPSTTGTPGPSVVTGADTTTGTTETINMSTTGTTGTTGTIVIDGTSGSTDVGAQVTTVTLSENNKVSSSGSLSLPWQLTITMFIYLFDILV